MSLQENSQTAYQFKVSPTTPLFVLNVTNSQLNGICSTAYCIYGYSNVDKMFKFGRVSDGGIGTDTVGELMADGVFALADNISHFEELPVMEPGQTWLQYVQYIEDTLDYTDIKDYSCILKDTAWVLVKFNNMQFLEGVLGACNWLGKDWRKIINYLHHGETPMNNLDVKF